MSNDVAPAGEALTLSLPATTAHGGTLTTDTNNDGGFTYTPATGFAGTDTFTYTITTTHGKTATATVTLNVATATPTANADSYTATEDAALTISQASGVIANDTIPAGETVSVTLPSTTAHGGTLTPDTNHDGGFTYTPATGYVGTDTFTYTITTTNGKTATATATITVNAANPTATTDTYAASENTGLTINQASGLLSNDVSPAGEALTLFLPPTTAHGGVLIADTNNDGGFTYTPATGFVGTDTFTYTITTTHGKTATATVTLNVAAATPTANADSYTATEDAALNINQASGVVANDTIPAGETVSVSLPSTTLHGGTLTPDSGHDGGFIYTPASGYVGTDTFTYTITTTNGKTATATATITVNAANPTAIGDTYTASENTGLTINQASGLLNNDIAPAGEALSLTLPSTTAHGGTLTPDANNDGGFTYTPATGFAGTDTFTYTITTTHGKTATATVTLNVAAATPTANVDSYTANEDAALIVSQTSGVLTNDVIPAGETVSVSLPSTTLHGGTLTPDSGHDGGFIYTPASGYVGTDTFTYTITTTNGKTATATATITVNAANPTAITDTYIASENTGLTINQASGLLNNDITPAGEALSLTLPSTTAHGGTLTPDANNDGGFTYTPATGFAGTDTFTYTITTTHGKTATATVTLNVAAATPTANVDTYTATEDSAFTISQAMGVVANDVIPAGETVSVTLPPSTLHGGTLTPDSSHDGGFIYTPATGYVGTDTFVYTITTTNGKTATATATITVNAANPTATADAYAASENTGLTINQSSGLLSNDIAPGGEALSLVLPSTTSHGGTFNSRY